MMNIGIPEKRSWRYVRGLDQFFTKLIQYKAEHQSLLNMAAATVQFSLPQDIVMNNVLPFLALPLHMFEYEDDEAEHGVVGFNR